jgi:N-acylneuraminate cytidylyltransferase
VICIIPARGGSKGVPRKNLATVGGRPLIERAVATAGAVFDAVIVSTDDPDIGAVAADAGALVHERRRALAGDDVTSEAVLVDVLEGLDELPPWFGFMQATSPFTTIDTLARIVERMSECDTCFTATRFHDRLLGPIGDSMRGVNGPVLSAPPPRQQRPEQWRETGAAYGIGTDGFLAYRARLFGTIQPVPVGPWPSLDIDTPEDLEAARALAGVLDPTDCR